MKAEKYGEKILEAIIDYESKNTIEDDDSSGAGKDESGGRAAKKLKTRKALVVIESSGDEA